MHYYYLIYPSPMNSIKAGRFKKISNRKKLMSKKFLHLTNRVINLY